MKALDYFPGILVLNETWLKEDNCDYAKINGYSSFHTIRENNRSGGVSIFYKSDINVQLINVMNISTESIECCEMKVALKREEYFLLAVYRPHSGTV